MEFDYVIVGAGSAGCALAGRLSENPNVTVALIEAGGRDRNPWIHIPVGYFKTLDNSATDWRYRTEPDPGLNGRSIKWPRGRVLGGSSSINGLLYVRGQQQDYDHWRQLGNTGWGWEEVAPIFRRMEDWEGHEQEATDNIRGSGGPISVAKTRLTRKCIDDWLAAAKTAGYRLNPDYNGADQEGVAPFQLTMRRGLRHSAAVAYLNPARGRKNFLILTNAQVQRIEIANGRATGVVIDRGGSHETVVARREIILSAGAIGSPHLLMLSGVGPGEHLAEHGIAVQQNLPGIGRNLQDHLQARPVFKCRSSTINTESRSLLRRAGMALEFACLRTGAMTMAASLGAAFLKTKPELETPDIQFHIQPFSADNPTDGTHHFDAFTASVCVLRPESVGEIRLKSADPKMHPAIHPNYLSTVTDCQTLTDGIRIARRIAKLPPLKDEVIEEYSPGPGIGDDDDAILDWARNTSTTIYHPTGTCKMGPSRDELSVVDARLNVHGIRGLRVADASIMPQITSGNTNAPAIMIGERASDFIREDMQTA